MTDVHVASWCLEAVGGWTHKIGTRGNDSLSGHGGDDWFEGLAGNDTLKGRAGNDVLDGGAGVDTASYGDKTRAVSVTLAGAANATVFVGGIAEDTLRNIENVTGGNVDTIVDFDNANDRIALSHTIFASVGTAGTALSPDAFHLGTAASDAADRIIHDQATGGLLYDVDGTGATTAVQFATVSGGIAMTADNFIIIYERPPARERVSAWPEAPEDGSAFGC